MKKIATPKQTGQGGTDTENKAIAYFLAAMLARVLPFPRETGLITRIDFQVAADGWLFDDALLTLNDNGVIKKIAVSVKSNHQFTRNGCPKELNRLLWEQYLCVFSNVFKSGNDAMCLIDANISATTSADLNTILSQAKAQNPEDFHKRIYVDKYSSKAKQKIYESFQCPADLEKTYLIKVSETGNLLKHFIHVEMDFNRDSSACELNAIEICRTILKSGSSVEAKSLFEVLCRLSLRLAGVNGFLDICALVNHIRGQFHLTNFPDHQTDWNKIQQHNTDKLSLISTDLGKKVSIDRSPCLLQIDEKLLIKPICFIVGISGAGKTVLAKEFAETKQAKCKIIWLDVADFDGFLETNLQIQHTLPEIIRADYSNEAYLVIDGAERLYGETQRQKLGLLISTIVSANLQWKIIMTCPVDGVDPLLTILNQLNVNTEFIDSYSMPNITDETVLQLIKQFPELGSFLMNHAVRNLLNNLKLLDKIIFNIKKISTLSEIGTPGETHLIDFIWQEEVEHTQHGIQKSSFLKIVAEKQADQLTAGVSVADLDPVYILMADELKKAGFIKSQQQKIYFTHDLYSDWSRYILLLSHNEHLGTFLNAKRLLSPLWIKAIRLYGLYLLEQDLSGKKWERTYSLFSGGTSQQIIIQNLLLESFFLSPNAYEILTKHKNLLFNQEAKLFKKLMSLFLITATTANPEMLQLAKQIGGISEMEASSYDRLPIMLYWPDVLEFLHDNITDSLEFTMLSAVEVASIWLDKTPLDIPGRKEAGNITLQAANFMFNKQINGAYVDGKITDTVYKGLLLGFSEDSEAVGDLCLKLCKRRHFDKPDDHKKGSLLNLTSPSILDQRDNSRKIGMRWGEGPFERVDNSFQKLCLETNSLMSLLYLNPALGKEILLAVLIDEPRDRYLGSTFFDHDYCIHNPTGWFPPFFLRGPFLNFLRMHPKEAIDFIVRITNFATSRWLETERAIQKKEKSITIELSGNNKQFYGDSQVFGWHKNVGNAPHSIVCILMAFEQFLHEEIEKNNPIGTYVEYALLQTHSLAIVGVLLNIGKLQPTLFANELKPLLPVVILYTWDLHMGLGNSSFENDLPKSWTKQVDKWLKRRRKTLSLKDSLIEFFLFNSQFQTQMNEIIPFWKKELETIESPGSIHIFLLQMIPQFNMENYQERIVDGKSYMQFVEPKEISEKLKPLRENTIADLQESHVSYKMDMIIENNLPFDLPDAEYLWERMQKWQPEITPDHIRNDYELGSPLRNILSSLLVFLNSKDVWVEAHPEYLTWVKSFFEYLIDQRLEHNDADDTYGMHMDWNIKLASILPKLWKDSLKDKSYRKAVAGILILFNDNTVSAFFSAAKKIFKWQEPEFIKLQNLCLSYYNETRQIFLNSHAHPGQLRSIQKKYIQDFADDVISETLMDWPEIIDFHKTRLLLSCLPYFNSVALTDQQDHVFFLIKQGLSKMGERLTSRLDKLRDHEHTDEFDQTVLLRVADCLPYIEDEDESTLLWTEIVKYGYLASEWIKFFFNGFFRMHLQHPENYGKIIALLNKMVIFTSTWRTWDNKQSFKRWEDFRDCILGLDPRTVNLWKNDYSEFVIKAAFLYKYWFNKNKYNPHTISAMMTFIISDSGIMLLKDGFNHLRTFFALALEKRNEKPPEGRIYVGHKELDEKLASTLSFLWDQKSNLIKDDVEMFSIYRELLQYLVAIENIIGVELHLKLLHS